MKLVNRLQMNHIDQSASSVYHIPSLLLMEHAAHEVYLHLEKTLVKTSRIVIVCGSGNNGGDGFALARLLSIKGYDVSVYMAGNKEHFTKDALLNYETCKTLGIAFVESIKGFDVIVDCLFGTGLHREVKGEYAKLIEAINHSNAYVVSIDIPSGIDCDSGKVLGCAVKADITYTMQCGKIGLYVYPGRTYSGKVVVVDIFIPKTLIETCESQMYLIEKNDMVKMLPKRKIHSHKGTYGKVLCIGGSVGMSGAILMAAKSAMHSGCGMIICAVCESIAPIVANSIMESMSIVLPEKDGHIAASATKILKERIEDYDVVLIGCGIGRSEDIVSIMRVVLDSSAAVVIDADALYAYQKIMDEYPMRKNVILTPHMKEFATLYGIDVNVLINNSVAYANEFAQKYPETTLVLKSETTLIASKDSIYVNTYGNNGLAKGGSGDVLAGIITGMMAQKKEVFTSAVLGVFLHAYSADVLVREKSEYSICPSDIIESLDHVLHVLKEKCDDTYS